MDKLAKSLDDVITGSVPTLPGDSEKDIADVLWNHLEKAAVEWSKFCIEDLDEKLVGPGLEISGSIARFIRRLEKLDA